jgi:hypothetical protein
VVVRVVTGTGGGDGVSVMELTVLVEANVAEGAGVVTAIVSVGTATGVSVGKGVEVGAIAVSRLHATNDGASKKAHRRRNANLWGRGISMTGIMRDSGREGKS